MPEEHKTVPIRNYDHPKNPRVFDVIVDRRGQIEEYQVKDIKGFLSIKSDDVNRQIEEALR